MDNVIRTLGPKQSQQGTRAMAQTHGKVAPSLAGARPAVSVYDGTASNRAYQAPELAGNDQADSVSPGPLPQ